MIFHDSSWPTIIFHNLPSLENEILKFHYFFMIRPNPVRKKKPKQNKTKQNKQRNKKIEINPTPASFR